MDYKELIEQLRKHHQSWAAYSDLEFAHALEDAAAAIETLLAEREAAGWISVDEKLPELYTPVIICRESGYSTRAIYWMPLPTPPDRERPER